MSNYSWYKEGSEIPPPFKSVSPSTLGPPSNSGIQGPPFQPLNITYEFDQPYKQEESKMQATGKISSNKQD